MYWDWVAISNSDQQYITNAEIAAGQTSYTLLQQQQHGDRHLPVYQRIARPGPRTEGMHLYGAAPAVLREPRFAITVTHFRSGCLPRWMQRRSPRLMRPATTGSPRPNAKTAPRGTRATSAPVTSRSAQPTPTPPIYASATRCAWATRPTTSSMAAKRASFWRRW